MSDEKAGYNRFLLLVAGLGGLLYGVDVGIIAGALPYLEATSGLNGGQLSIVVAAVLLGSVISTLFAGALADWIGRKPLMMLSGLLFVCSIPIIALSHGYQSLVLGRLLQGISAGLIGVVVPLYLAECLAASSRGKGTGIFQWLLTLGIVTAAIVGMFFSIRVEEVARLGDPARLFAFKDTAWRSIFWVSLPPGILFVIGSLMVSESPRWLFRRGKRDAAYAALLRSRTKEQADIELAEMEQAAVAEKASSSTGGKIKESLLRRKYVIPFVLACVILACNCWWTARDGSSCCRSGAPASSCRSSAPAYYFARRKSCAWILAMRFSPWLTPTRRSRCFTTRRRRMRSLLRAEARRLVIGLHLWSSSIRTEIFARRPRLRVPTTRQPSPLRSRAKAACPPTK